MKKILVIGLVTLIFVSCGQKDILNGTITDKDFRESYIQVGTRVQRIGNTTTVVPTTTIYPDRWTITIYDEIENEESKTSINESLYNTLHVGDTVMRIDGTVTKIN